jgi:hypothetical protein
MVDADGSPPATEQKKKKFRVDDGYRRGLTSVERPFRRRANHSRVMLPNARTQPCAPLYPAFIFLSSPAHLITNDVDGGYDP